MSLSMASLPLSSPSFQVKKKTQCSLLATNNFKRPLPPLNPKDPFLSKLASVAATAPEKLLLNNSDMPPYLDIFDSPTLMATPATVERSVSYNEHRPRRPPPDLPSLLLHGRIVYLGMPLVPAVTELIIAELMYLQWMDPKEPIYLYINSTGTTRDDGESVGMETEGFAIYDAMMQLKNEEITVIATDPTLLPPDAAADEVGGKAVELRSYIDPTKENDSSLHTQLWIDPCEEFVQYTHTGDPVDVTFGVKELKAFLSFCEGCEVDIHLYFEKAGEPILMAPKFGLEDVSVSNFDATLVLATMLVSQLHDRTTSTEPIHAAHGTEDQVHERPKGNVSEHPSDHTRIWSELSASAAKSATGTSGLARRERDLNTNEHVDIQRISTINISNAGEEGRNFQNNTHQPMQTEHGEEPQDGAEINGQGVVSQRHHSNWVDDEEDDEGEDSEPYVQATPPYCEE